MYLVMEWFMWIVGLFKPSVKKPRAYFFDNRAYVFDSIVTCQNLVDVLYGEIQRKGFITVHQFKSILDVDATPEDREYGWRSIVLAVTETTKDGKIRFILPMPKKLTTEKLT